MLENDACPSKFCTQTMNVKPLELAAEYNKPEIVDLLLANNELRENCKSYGALHWAITHKMFKVVKTFIEKGYDLNEYYYNKTPIGAALACGKNNSDDARMVKLLLNANADVLKKSKLCPTTYGRGEQTDLVNVARVYSNSKCLALVESAYHAATY